MYEGDESFKESDQSYSIPNSCESGIFSSHLFNTGNNRKNSISSCINAPQYPRNSFLRQTQFPKYGRSSNYSENKQSNKSSGKYKNHKNSFQFGANTPRNERFSTYSNADDK